MTRYCIFGILLISTATVVPQTARAWGEVGHRLIVDATIPLVDKAVFTNCHVTPEAILAHTNDPDTAWKRQRAVHPDEPRAHFFHVDAQPGDWRARTEAKDKTHGYLVYRIVDWVEKAKTLRKEKKWGALADKLYGLSHYLADLSQPLHVHSDHDGDKAGLPDLHSQFESKLVKRYELELKSNVRRRLINERVPEYWSLVRYSNLVFDTAQQSNAKALRLFELARQAVKPPRKSKRTGRQLRPHYTKALLWEKTGALASDQLALGARLFAHTLNQICR